MESKSPSIIAIGAVFAIVIGIVMALAGPGSKLGTGWQYLTSGQTTSQQSSNSRIDQTDRSQYTSQQEWATWHGVSCSAAAMAYVLNGLGGHYTIHDVLQAETGQISSNSGLYTGFDGIATTVSRLGYHASAVSGGIDGIIGMANGGNPVIISMQNSDWTFGHVLVVTGGDTSTLQVVDSWTTNRTSISRVDFANQWTGLAATVKGGAQ